jgi:hypothetical protein
MTRPIFGVRPTSITLNAFFETDPAVTPSAKFILMIIIWAIRVTSCFVSRAYEKFSSSTLERRNFHPRGSKRTVV